MQNEQYKDILESLNTAILKFNKKYHLNYINPAGEMLMAISSRRLLGVHVDELFYEEKFVSSLHHALDHGEGFTQRELQLTLPNQNAITVDCCVTPIQRPGCDDALIVELLPISMHIRLSGESTLSTQQQLSRAVVRGLAHEIKNPLGGIRGAAQLLERELHENGHKEYTSVIIGEVDRLQNLVNRMLGPNTVPNYSTINIHQVLERVYSLVKAEISDDIRLNRDYDPSIPEIVGDFDQLIQAVLNIVRNSTQALEKQGQITLKTRTMRQFTIGQSRHKLVARIDIIDNGKGIAKHLIDSVFYPMVTDRAEGTGLGLSIAQSLIYQHNGIIECSSEPGNTRFTILLPLGRT